MLPIEHVDVAILEQDEVDQSFGHPEPRQRPAKGHWFERRQQGHCS